MLDNRSVALLEVINSQCVDCGYIVFDLEELVNLMPKQFSVDKEEIKGIISSLFQKEYISLKYMDITQVCLCPTPKSRLIFEKQIENQIQLQRENSGLFMHSMLGSIIGSLAMGLVFLLIFFVFGGKNA